MSVAASFLHESWTGDHKDGFDIAMLRLNEKADLPLPSVDEQGGDFKSGRLFTGVGWGKDTDGNLQKSLQVSDDMLYRDLDDCRQYYINKISSHTICAGSLGRNACDGLRPQQCAPFKALDF